MKRFIWTLILMLCLVGQSALAADFSRLIILHTNDTHGFDRHDEQNLGMDGIAAYKKDLEAKGYDVVLLDAGDALQDNNLVNYSKGKAAVEFMNAAGYDAGTLGNHEFDYGQAVLAERLSEYRFPIVSCNITVDATGKRLVPPTAILDRPSGRLGIIGIATPQTIGSTSPKNVYGLSFMQGKELYKEAQKQIDSLKAAGCDLIIGLGHLGSDEGSLGNRSEDVIANTKGLAIFIDGHDHRKKNTYLQDVLLVSTGSHTKNLGKLSFKEGRWVGELISAAEWTKQDPTVTSIIEKYNAEVQERLGQVLGSSTQIMDASRVPGVRTEERPLGDFVADAYLWQARQANVFKGRVHAAIVNGGGIRSNLPEGTIKRVDIVNMAPFNNQLYVCTITGEKLLEIMECATAFLPKAMGSMPQVAGIEYAVNTRVPYVQGPQYPNSLYYTPAKPGSRVTIKKVDGKPFSLKARYTVAMQEFNILGGENYIGLASEGAKLAVQSIGYLDAEAIENYLVTKLKGRIGKEYAKAKGRIEIIK